MLNRSETMRPILSIERYINTLLLLLLLLHYFTALLSFNGSAYPSFFKVGGSSLKA